jgi:hypothetical protein
MFCVVFEPIMVISSHQKAICGCGLPFPVMVMTATAADHDFFFYFDLLKFKPPKRSTLGSQLDVFFLLKLLRR